MNEEQKKNDQKTIMDVVQSKSRNCAMQLVSALILAVVWPGQVIPSLLADTSGISRVVMAIFSIVVFCLFAYGLVYASIRTFLDLVSIAARTDMPQWGEGEE